jgi:hypothetical protein
MEPMLLPAFFGFLGGVIAFGVALVLFYRRVLGRGDCVTISRGPGPEIYKDLDVLEHDPRPQGLYVRFRNRGVKPIEMAHFKIRAYKASKLWAEFQESLYVETQPGQEGEGVLKLKDYRSGPEIDLTDCSLTVEFLFGYVMTKKTHP